jgi:UPF0176 protein
MQKIILFYKFVPLKDAETIMHWQKALCSSANLKGRILISQHGINGTLGGEINDLKSYIRAMNLHSSFKGIEYKWSNGSAADFPKLSIKVRSEIVTFGIPESIKVDDNGVVGGGKKLKPKEVHQLVEERSGDVIFMDGRNSFEASIGRFKNAIIPNTKTTKDFINELDTPKMQAIKNRTVISYCTGGIRCEILTNLMIKNGFKDVYQIDGGIAKYGEEYGDDGFWEGKMYVFDRRMNVAFSNKSRDIGICTYCQGKTSNYDNCAYNKCSKFTLVCSECVGDKFFCNESCRLKSKALIE